MKKGHGPRSSSSPSPCAACKFLKRRCTPDCIFAPYFHSNDTQKFANVHKIFGASNVAKLLSEVPPQLREDTANSLAYEAEARVRDPVHGCVGDISLLQWKMLHLQHDLDNARVRLARYTNPHPFPSSSSSSASVPVFYDYNDIDVMAQLGSAQLASESIEDIR
ncbi:LOB domain-containing protein 21-like [Magnolia sinica]|uniref:LOB domain-containing protein 21-like n=1 Tax=Magnolia sinica TaxID=86752 RepID=UPI0026584659|nr:LOB domain-containing protein 21-like [Magnolia sinica]